MNQHVHPAQPRLRRLRERQGALGRGQVGLDEGLRRQLVRGRAGRRQHPRPARLEPLQGRASRPLGPAGDHDAFAGELFRIEGRCQSACTLFLGIRNVCVERSAELAFHGGNDRSGKISPASTQHMLNAYRPRLRQYLVAGGYVQTQAFHTISGAELIDKFGYKECR